jgi:hypothetical protein
MAICAHEHSGMYSKGELMKRLLPALLALLFSAGINDALAALPNALCELTRAHGLENIYANLALLDNSAPQVPPEELGY